MPTSSLSADMRDSATTSHRDRTFLGLVLLGAAIRIAYWISKWNEPLGFNDSLYYSGQARQLTEGIWFRELTSDNPGAEHGPLTSILMAPFSWMDDYVRWQRLPTLACGIASVWLIGRIATRLAGRRVGLLATGIAAVTPTLWLSDALVMSESVAILLVAAVLWFALETADNPSRQNLVVLGVLAGLAPLARSELALLIPVVAIWLAIARKRRGHDASVFTRRALPVLVVAGIVLAPWVGFNLARFEEPVLLTTNEGGTLLGANCFDSWDAIYPGAGGWSLLCLMDDPDSFPGEEPSVRNERQRTMALNYFRDNLPGAPRVLAARLLRTLDLYGIRDQVRADVGEERWRWGAWAGVPVFWLMALCVPFGLRRLGWRDRWLLSFPLILVVVTSVVFYGSHRIRSPAEVPLVLLAAIAIDSFIESRARESRARVSRARVESGPIS